MKLKNGVILARNGEEYVLITAGEAMRAFPGMIRLNDTAAAAMRELQHETTQEALVQSLTARYEVSEEVARTHVQTLLEQLRSVALLEE